MALLREHIDDEYLPEYGTLVLRDGPGGPLPDFGATPVPPRDYPDGAQPCGTICRAGPGFLEGAAGDGYQVVRLELHDGPPEDDRADWAAMMQTPVLTRMGEMGLTMVTGGAPTVGLDLGGPGRYAVRVARRGEHPDVEWRLSFWSDPTGSTVYIPQWMKRLRAAVGAGHDGWSTILGHRAQDLANIVWATTTGLPATEPSTVDVGVDQVEAWGLAHARPVGWLDAPLFAPLSAAPPTGHADLDARAEQLRQEHRARLVREAAALAGIAAQLDVDPPVVVRDLLGLLAAAGVLASDGANGQPRYRPGQPLPAVDVLRLPEAVVRQLRGQDARARYTSFATDLVSIAVWAPQEPVVSTVDDLASRLLATPAEVRGALAWAAAQGQLVVVEGEADQVRLSIGPGANAAGPAAMAPPARPAGPDDPRARARQRPPHEGPPVAVPPSVAVAIGAPPRAGYLTGAGDLVVWRDGRPVTLAAGDGAVPYRAIETAHGVAMFGPRGTQLVRPDGTIEQLGEALAFHGVVSEDGRYLAFAEGELGRHPWHTVELVDLADGSRHSLRWPDGDIPLLSALHGGAVYARGRDALVRWIPGTDPEPLPYQLRGIDPFTGTRLTIEGTPEFVLTRPDGTTTRIAVDLSAMLAPGGTRLYTLRYSPAAATLFTVDGAGTAPVVHWLPACDMNLAGPRRPCWEDADHLLFMATGSQLGATAPAIRLDVGTGAIEGVPLPGPGYQASFVQPLLRSAPAVG